ncbi:hypothetical protein D1872_240350 [compost metagenome]
MVFIVPIAIELQRGKCNILQALIVHNTGSTELQLDNQFAVRLVHLVVEATICRGTFIPAIFLKRLGEGSRRILFGRQVSILTRLPLILCDNIYGTLQLLEGLFNFIILKLSLPGLKLLLIKLQRVHESNPDICPQLVFLFINRVEGSVVHVSESILELFVLIDAPHKSYGKVMHNHIVNKQIRPFLGRPQSLFGQGFFQPL